MCGKKIWSLVLCVCLLLSLLAFPAGADEVPENGVVRIYYWYDPDEGMLDSIAWVEEKYKIKVEWEVVSWQMLYPRFATEIANGTGPDVMNLCNQRFPLVAIQKLVRPLDELNQELVNHPLLVKNNRVAREYYTYAGKSYAVRGNVEPRWIFYNKTMFEDYGMETPRELYDAGEWTMDAFKECAMEIMDYDEEGNVTTFGFGSWVYDMWFLTNGGEMLVETGDGGLRLTMDDPKVLWGWQFFQDGFLKDKFIKPNGNKNQDVDFATGAIAMSAESIWRVKNFNTMKDEWDFVPVPVGPDNTTGVIPGQCDGWGVTTCSKNPDGAMLFLIGMEEYAAEHPGDEADLYGFTEEQAALYRKYTTDEMLVSVKHDLLEGVLSNENLLYSYYEQITGGLPIATVNAIFAPVFQAEIDALLAK